MKYEPCFASIHCPLVCTHNKNQPFFCRMQINFEIMREKMTTACCRTAHVKSQGWFIWNSLKLVNIRTTYDYISAHSRLFSVYITKYTEILSHYELEGLTTLSKSDRFFLSHCSGFMGLTTYTRILVLGFLRAHTLAGNLAGWALTMHASCCNIALVKKRVNVHSEKTSEHLQCKATESKAKN